MHGGIQDCYLYFGWHSCRQVRSRLRCKACKTIFQLMFVRRSKSFPRLNLMWNEVPAVFSMDEAQMPKYKWTTLSLLCINSRITFFSDTDNIYYYKMTLLEAVVGLCSGTLYPYFSKSLAFPSWSLF